VGVTRAKLGARSCLPKALLATEIPLHGVSETVPPTVDVGRGHTLKRFKVLTLDLTLTLTFLACHVRRSQSDLAGCAYSVFLNNNSEQRLAKATLVVGALASYVQTLYFLKN
jgi:hypothetical protein